MTNPSLETLEKEGGPIDPFAPPVDNRPHRGSLDPGRVVSDALVAVYLRWPQVAIAVVALSAFTVVPVVGALASPYLTWAARRFALDLADGRADLSRLWSKVTFDVLVSTTGALVVQGVLWMPFFVVVGLALRLTDDLGDSRVRAGVLGLALTIPYGVLVVRFGFAMFFVAEQSASVDAAFRRSWKATKDCWIQLGGLEVLTVVLTVPGRVLAVASPARVVSVDVILMQLAQALVANAGMIVGYAVFAVACRQLVPRPTAGPV